MATISIVAAGAMGSAIGARLTGNGARVLTSLDGRSPATVALAEAAGMEGVDEPTLCRADLILSIVPPSEAMRLAERLRPLLAAVEPKPVYVDGNALNVETKIGVADCLAGTGVAFIDAAIIGSPPKPGQQGPRIYIAGDALEPALALRDLGLDIRAIEGGIGAAAALKMSYAGINKGLTALAAAMVLAATRAGAAPALLAELAENEPELLARFGRVLPDMIPKAYRWVAEMREIAGFLGEEQGGSGIFDGMAPLYDHLSRSSGEADVAALRSFARAIASRSDSGPAGDET